MKLALSLLVLILPIISMACLNKEAVTLKDGYDLYQDSDLGFVPYGHTFMINPEGDFSIESRLKRLDSLWKKTNDVAYLSDYGVVLIVGGRYNEAIKLYLEIERTHPGRYSTASNIGTAYELNGNNKEAIRWIKRAIKINPASHFNSEWLHIKILEAKLKGEQFYTSDFLIGSNFGAGLEPITKLSHEQLLQLRDALFYQLNERVSFVEPEDRIVAVLLYDLANVNFLTGDLYDALRTYEMAKRYGMSGNVLDTRYIFCGKNYNIREKSLSYSTKQVSATSVVPKQKRQGKLVYVLGFLAAAGVGVLIFKKLQEI